MECSESVRQLVSCLLTLTLLIVLSYIVIIWEQAHISSSICQLIELSSSFLCSVFCDSDSRICRGGVKHLKYCALCGNRTRISWFQTSVLNMTPHRHHHVPACVSLCLRGQCRLLHTQTKSISWRHFKELSVSWHRSVLIWPLMLCRIRYLCKYYSCM